MGNMYNCSYLKNENYGASSAIQLTTENRLIRISHLNLLLLVQRGSDN